MTNIKTFKILQNKIKMQISYKIFTRNRKFAVFHAIRFHGQRGWNNLWDE